MNNTIFILAAVASLLLVKAETGNYSGIFNLINLGRVDGKNYFYEYITYRNWAAAGKYCKESGLELATIETQAQADFLKSKYSFTGFRNSFWTARRDAHLPREFSWNTTGMMTNEISGLPWFAYTEYQTCVMYTADGSPALENLLHMFCNDSWCIVPNLDAVNFVVLSKYPRHGGKTVEEILGKVSGVFGSILCT